jgi:hypothetical protein
MRGIDQICNRSARRPVAAPIDKLLQDVIIARRDDLYMSLGRIPHPTPNPKPVRLLFGRDPKKNALHPPFDQKMYSRHDPKIRKIFFF